MIIFLSVEREKKLFRKTGGQNWLLNVDAQEKQVIDCNSHTDKTTAESSSSACFLEVVFTFVVYLGLFFSLDYWDEEQI